MKLKGKVHKYGADIDTDVIIPAQYLETTDPEILAKHCLEDLDEEFIHKVQPGDLLVAGKNFGCGSSREHAPVAIKASGIGGMIAKSFARIFYRNAINIGLPILESEEAVEGIDNGDIVEVDLASGDIVNMSKGKIFRAKPFPEFIIELISAGGLVQYTKRRKGIE